jgi:hypothetical protein
MRLVDLDGQAGVGGFFVIPWSARQSGDDQSVEYAGLGEAGAALAATDADLVAIDLGHQGSHFNIQRDAWFGQTANGVWLVFPPDRAIAAGRAD